MAGGKERLAVRSSILFCVPFDGEAKTYFSSPLLFRRSTDSAFARKRLCFDNFAERKRQSGVTSVFPSVPGVRIVVFVYRLRSLNGALAFATRFI